MSFLRINKVLLFHVVCSVCAHPSGVTVKWLRFSLEQVFLHDVQHALELTEEQDTVFPHHRNVSINGRLRHTAATAAASTACHANAAVQQQLSAIQYNTTYSPATAVCNTIQYNLQSSNSCLQYNTIQYNTIQPTVSNSCLQYNTIQYNLQSSSSCPQYTIKQNLSTVQSTVQQQPGTGGETRCQEL